MNRLNVPNGEQGEFATTFDAVVSNWAAVALDIAANPGSATGGGSVIYTNAGGLGRSYPVNWSVNVQNWVRHTSCHVVVTNVW